VEFIGKTLTLVAEEKSEARTRELWLTLLPHMAKKISYEDFRDRARGGTASVSTTPAEEVLAKVRRIREARDLKTQST
jgi:hypothetical protein